MVTAFIVSTGTELLLGTTADTNSIFLSRRLTELGIKVQGKIVAGDDAGNIKSAFEYGLTIADIVISSGGLGPTHDDLTKGMACEVMNCQMELVEEEWERIKGYFAKRGRPMPESNIKQAMFPADAIILKNNRGTAPGMYLKKEAKLIVLLPGPPHEMKPMYLRQVEPRLAAEYALRTYASRTIKVFGPGESQVELMLGDLIEKPDGYNMALTAKSGEIHIGIQVYDDDADEGLRKLDEITERVREKLGNNIFGLNEETMVEATASSLRRQGKKIALAESCTGGLLAKMLTDLPGSSDYFWGSITAYSDEAKQLMLKVNEETLKKFGAVSFETAEEMVRGLIKMNGADVGVSITGIAGPSGGSDDKPVGLVYIGIICHGSYTVKELKFVGQRDMVRVLAAKTALDMVRRKLDSLEGK